jgi:hypothetical protein
MKTLTPELLYYDIRVCKHEDLQILVSEFEVSVCTKYICCTLNVFIGLQLCDNLNTERIKCSYMPGLSDN